MTLASDALSIATAGVRAVDPAAAVARAVVRRAGGVGVGSASLRTRAGGRFHLVAIGKAAGSMVDAAARAVGHDVEGLAVTPRGYPPPKCSIPACFGNHPVPRAGSFRAGNRVLQYVRDTGPGDAILFLISGGGSAVAEVPSARVTADDFARTTQVLLGSGAPIGALNSVRRHLSQIKGGQLAMAAGTRCFATVALSDVVGDPPEDIASGPTVGDPSSFHDADRVVKRYRLASRLPTRVLLRLREGREGRVSETPKPGEPRLARAPFVLAASNALALAAAAKEARRRGYDPTVLSSRVVGETQPVARRFAADLRRAARDTARPIALLSGGETTVTLGRSSGRGGRNQEFALAAALELSDRTAAVVLSMGTDGIDGPTDAAGGWVDEGTLRRARLRRVDLVTALRTHASYDALDRLGGLIKTGATGTNVMDLHVGLASPGRQSGYGRK